MVLAKALLEQMSFVKSTEARRKTYQIEYLATILISTSKSFKIFFGTFCIVTSQTVLVFSL